MKEIHTFRIGVVAVATALMPLSLFIPEVRSISLLSDPLATLLMGSIMLGCPLIALILGTLTVMLVRAFGNTMRGTTLGWIAILLAVAGMLTFDLMTTWS